MDQSVCSTVVAEQFLLIRISPEQFNSNIYFNIYYVTHKLYSINSFGAIRFVCFRARPTEKKNMICGCDFRGYALDNISIELDEGSGVMFMIVNEIYTLVVWINFLWFSEIYVILSIIMVVYEKTINTFHIFVIKKFNTEYWNTCTWNFIFDWSERCYNIFPDRNG